MPPPRYQKDGTLPTHYPNNIANHTRTLPHPRHNINSNYEPRSRDDQMLNKTNYVTAPSPGPPLDGSYYNNSDRYLSYPPMVSSQRATVHPPASSIYSTSSFIFLPFLLLVFFFIISQLPQAPLSHTIRWCFIRRPRRRRLLSIPHASTGLTPQPYYLTLSD